jgi:hypothetical protein
MFFTDTLRTFLENQNDVWAGWKDAPLSNHGTYGPGSARMAPADLFLSRSTSTLAKIPIPNIIRNKCAHIILLLGVAAEARDSLISPTNSKLKLLEIRFPQRPSPTSSLLHSSVHTIPPKPSTQPNQGHPARSLFPLLFLGNSTSVSQKDTIGP